MLFELLDAPDEPDELEEPEEPEELEELDELPEELLPLLFFVLYLRNEKLPVTNASWSEGREPFSFALPRPEMLPFVNRSFVC